MAELRLDVDLLHPRGRVWRALTESRLLNEWFQPIVGWPEADARVGDVGWVHPTEELPGFTSFEVELIEADQPFRLVLRWHGGDFTSDVIWELTPTELGCRLSVTQTGFLGSGEAGRRQELLNGYLVMVQQRLPAVLDRLSEGAQATPLLPRPMPEPSAARVRVLSLLGAVTLVVLCTSAAAVWLHRGEAGMSDPGRGYGLGMGSQPGVIVVGSPSPWVSPSPAHSPTPGAGQIATPPSPASSGDPLTANYKTIALLGLGGFDTEITVRNPGDVDHHGWTVVITMPDATTVKNRSPDVVHLEQDGAVVTLTPVQPRLGPSESVTFVVRFPALLALGKSITSCTINGRACTAG